MSDYSGYMNAYMGYSPASLLDQLDAGSISGDKIAARTLVAEQIAAHSITADSAVIAEAAITDANIINLTADKLTAGTIDVSEISIVLQGTNFSVVRFDALGLYARNNAGQTTFFIDRNTGNATFRGQITGGSILSETTINVTTDAFVGNNIHLGSWNGSGTRMIRFLDTANIQANASGYGGFPMMKLEATGIYLDADDLEVYRLGGRSQLRVWGIFNFQTRPQFNGVSLATLNDIPSTSGFVRDQFSQGMSLYQDNASGRIVFWRNGVNLGSIALDTL